MRGADLLVLYRQATSEAFRLEAQQQYAVEAEAAQMRAFAEGRPLPSDPHVNKSMDIVRALVAAGVRVRRVHVVDLPLSAYLRYEMAAYQENIAAGEQVGIAVRARHADLAALTEDFVLFDAGTSHQAVVWMRYDEHGRLIGNDYSDAEADLAHARRHRDIAIAHAIPLDDFAAMPEAG
jgi:Family of unknown function (DUF6879)